MSIRSKKMNTTPLNKLDYIIFQNEKKNKSFEIREKKIRIRILPQKIIFEIQWALLMELFHYPYVDTCMLNTLISIMCLVVVVFVIMSLGKVKDHLLFFSLVVSAFLLLFLYLCLLSLFLWLLFCKLMQQNCIPMTSEHF